MAPSSRPSVERPSWFETHGVAVLLTMRVREFTKVLDLILRRPQRDRLEG
jgi:hypothetical protein